MTKSSKWGELSTHDPSIIKTNGYFYVYSTDASYDFSLPSGVQIRRSKDLIHWEYRGTAFENYGEECKEAVKYARLNADKNHGFWAPDIIKTNGIYRLYFSASTFGSSRSCISMAESENPEGPFSFKGIVIASQENNIQEGNAIDPGILEDHNGNLYMVYGSFFGGIFIVELDKKTGFLKDTKQKPIRLLGGKMAAVEGPVIRYIAESGYYYLFLSYGSLSSDYNIRVGRAKEITGPYFDADGKELSLLSKQNEEEIGTKVMGGFTFASHTNPPVGESVMAPGHNGLYVEGNDYFIVHHARSYAMPEHWFIMNIRRFAVNRYGWPVIFPHRYNGEFLTEIDLENGEYALVRHGKDNNARPHVSSEVILQNGKIDGSVKGTFQCYEDYRISLVMDGKEYDGVIIQQYDRKHQKSVQAISAMSQDGFAVWLSTQL